MRTRVQLTAVFSLLLCVAPVVCQTTTTPTTTQTAAQKAAAVKAAQQKAIEAKKQADLKRAEELRKADEQKRLAAANAAGKPGATGTTGATSTAATTAATPTGVTQVATPAASNAVAAPAQAATPKAAPAAWGMPAATGPAAGSTGAANSLTATAATFKNYDLTLNNFGCLRAGTRLFCDFDVYNRTPYQIASSNGNLYANFRLVLGGGRVVGPTLATFVDGDGNTFTNAALSASSPVRMLVQFDNVPETVATVGLTMGSARADGLPVSAMPAALANGGVPGRVAAQGAAANASAAKPATAATGASATTNATSQANNALQKANTAKSGLSGLLSGAKSVISH